MPPTCQPTAAERSIRPPASTALGPIRALATRPKIAGRGMEKADSQRLTETPASPEASDALPGTSLPHAEKRVRWALAGFFGPGARRARGGERLVAHRSRQAWRGPACLAGEAAARTAAQGAVPGTVPDRPWPRPLPSRIVKRMHKTGFRLGRPAVLGLRLSGFRGFPVSGHLPTRGMACRGCPPADADVHGRRPSGGTFRRSSCRCCSQW
jgi:hypothetical protein